jgi:hypothetical protein
MSDAAQLLTLQFLDWLAARPRSYAETMEAWRSSCPRLSIWEDALGDGLVRLEPGATRDESRVTLTAQGHALLETRTVSADGGGAR